MSDNTLDGDAALTRLHRHLSDALQFATAHVRRQERPTIKAILSEQAEGLAEALRSIEACYLSENPECGPLRRIHGDT